MTSFFFHFWKKFIENRVVPSFQKKNGDLIREANYFTEFHHDLAACTVSFFCCCCCCCCCLVLLALATVVAVVVVAVVVVDVVVDVVVVSV